MNQVAQGEVQRATAVVERVLTRAGNEGERAVSWARIILGGIIAIAWPLVTYDEMIHGEISDWIVVDCSLVAVVFSVGIIRWLRTHDVTPSLRTISIVVDGVIVLGVLSSFVLNPPPSWLGIGRASIVGIAYFAILAVGLRVSRRGVITALLLFAVGIGCLMAIDDARNAKDDTIANRVTIAALLVNAAVYAWLVAKRTRTLVLEGAAQTSLAERALARLGSYLSEEIAAHALANDTIHMGGVRQDVAILFSDLRAFTSISEKMDPEQIVSELNEYFEAMVAAVTAAGGVVDKYIGDSIMAVFGAPRQHPDDATRAVRAAYGMEKALEKLNASRARRGWAPLRHGIGVHYGPAVAGNIGTTQRAQYTVVGDTVNVAARLESCTKEVGVPVLLSQAVVERLAGTNVPLLKRLADVKARGREERIAVYTFVVTGTEPS